MYDVVRSHMSFLVVCAQTEEAYVLVRRCVWEVVCVCPVYACPVH